MKTTKLIQKGLMALLSIALMASLAMGQVFKNNGTLTNTNAFNTGTFQNYRTLAGAGTVYNSGLITVTTYKNSDATLNGTTNNQNLAGTTAGTIDVTGNYANSTGFTYNSLSGSVIKVGGTLTNTTAANFDTQVGKVDYKGATLQTVLADILNSKYGALTLSGGGDNVKTLGGSVAVDGLVTIALNTEFEVGASNTLTLNAATPFSNSGTFTANGASATTVYNAGGSQDVTGAAYYNLTLSAGGTKTVNTGATTVAIAAEGTLANNGTFDLVENALTTTATSTITNGANTIRTQGSVTFGAAHTITGTFIYENATSTQSIGAATYGSLTLQGGLDATGQKNFPSGTVSVTGTYSTADANRNYGTGTFAYAGTTAQSVLGGSAENYKNLTISGSGGADTSVYKTVTVGNLYVQTDLTIEAGRTLNMASNAFNTLPAGTKSNLGKIMWAAGNSHVIGGSGTTELYGSGNMAAGTYGNVWLTNGASVTIPAATSVISTGGSGVAGEVGFFIKGASTALTLAAANSELTVTSGDLDNEGIITNAGTITVN